MPLVRSYLNNMISANTAYTDNTNSSNLELYSILGEYDNAGFPLTYCLLSTAEALEIGKRKKALNAWASVLRDKYGIIPIFADTDKDMAEIGMLRDVWILIKIQLCWWHLRKAVRERLAKNKLSTTPYNAKHARAEFGFIDITFTPAGRADPHEYEGGIRDIVADINKEPPRSSPNTITFTIKPPPKPEPIHNLRRQTARSNTSGGTKLSAESKVKVEVSEPETEEDVTDDVKSSKRQVFCPEEHRQPIVDMMEAHLCAHPLIPGYSHPSPEGIREWAVKEMYQFCVKHEMRETWAYLWENWYRKGRWELWAHSCHAEIPILKTTMMLESQ